MRHLSTGAATRIFTGGRRFADMLWRDFLVELRTSRYLDARSREQLPEFAAHARAEGYRLAYMYLNKPAQSTIDTVKKAGRHSPLPVRMTRAAMTRRGRGSTAVIAELRSQLSAALEGHGLQSAGLLQLVEGRAFVRWIRARGWRRDTFELDYGVRRPDSIGAKVIVRILLGAGREVTVDMASVAFLAGRGSDYQFRDTSPEELVKMIDEDTERAMEWFELYEPRRRHWRG